MPTTQPTAADLHVDTLLTMLSIAYMNEADAYIADKLFPIVSVRKQSNLIPEYRKGDFFRDVAQFREPGTKSRGTGFRVIKDDTYYAQNFATHIAIPDEVRDNADEPFDPDAESTFLVVDRLKLRREIAWATDFFKIGVWKTDAVAGTDFVEWNDYASSDPFNDIQVAVDVIYKASAREARRLAMGRLVWSKWKNHPDFIERIKYTQRGVLTVDLVSSLLGLERIIIGNALQTTSDENVAVADDVLDFVFGKDALLMFVPPRPGLMTPAAGYTFHWKRFGALSYIRRLRNDEEMTDKIEGHTNFDQKKLGAELGYFFSNAVA
jgi:hypothetical protein